MKAFKTLQYLLLLGGVLFVISACEDEAPVNYAPTVTTGSATSIYRKGAFLAGGIESSNGAKIKEFGIMLSEFESMVEPLKFPASQNNNPMTFRVETNALTPNNTYYYQAYASSGASIVKGEVKSFITPETNAPIFSDVVLSDLGAQSVTVSSLIQDDGGSEILIHGFCWKEMNGNSNSPTVADNIVNVEIGPQRITAVIGGLAPENEYLICPYGINAAGLGYGETVRISTLSASAPVLTNIFAVDSTDLSISVRATIGDKGKSTITRIGFCWRTDGELPTVDDENCVLSKYLGNSSFEYKLDSLDYTTTYNIRAFAENEHGISYSDVLRFTTNYSGKPVVKDIVSLSSDMLSLVAQSELINEGKSSVIRKGFCWSETNHLPTVDDIRSEMFDTSLGVMKDTIDNLKRNTTYYIRAFAENHNGVGYSNVYIFTTKDPGAGIYSLADLIAFRDARNAGKSVSQWKNKEDVINIYADIDASSIDNWEPISVIYGPSETLDGNGHSITGLKIEYVSVSSEQTKLAFIKNNSGIIRNLTIEGSYSFQEQGNGVRQRIFVGGFCYYNGGTISNCTSEVDLLETFYDANCGADGTAGIAYMNSGVIEKCINKGEITVTSSGSGIVRDNSGGIILSCKNFGTISYIGVPNGDGNSVAGIGGCWQNAVIEDCVNYGTIKAKDIPYAGGISGGVYGTIKGCVNEGEVIGGYKSGGIVGEAYDGSSLIDCKNIGNVRPDESIDVSGVYGGIVGSLKDGTKYENNINGGFVEGQPGTDANAIGNDARN